MDLFVVKIGRYWYVLDERDEVVQGPFDTWGAAAFSPPPVAA